MEITRNQLLLSIFIGLGNIVYAFLKKALSVTTPLLIQSNKLTKSRLGKASTYFSLFYGLFKLIGIYAFIEAVIYFKL